MKGIATLILICLAALVPDAREELRGTSQGSAGGAAAEKPVDAREAKVRELMLLTGTKARSDALLEQVLSQYEKMRAILPKGFVEKFRAFAKEEDLLDRVMPIYMKHVDEETLDRALDFYRSAAGKRWSQAHGKISTDMVKAGEDWGRKLGRRILRDLRKGQ